MGCSRFARRYSGNRVCFLFLGVLRCFSSPGLPLATLCVQVGVPAVDAGGLPHSEIPGSKPAYGSPGHIGVRPVLHRLLAPRHPPCALSNFSSNHSGENVYPVQLHVDTHLLFLALSYPVFKVRFTTMRRDGGAERDRTADLLLARQALSQLSYSPVLRIARLIFLQSITGI